MTILGGHSIDALCYIAGEFAQISARVTTRITLWKHAVTGEDFPVDAPDTVTAAGLLKNGAEVSYQDQRAHLNRILRFHLRRKPLLVQLSVPGQS